jgi:hypothetical protein
VRGRRLVACAVVRAEPRAPAAGARRTRGAQHDPHTGALRQGRATIAARGFDADMQTRISLFLGAAKSVNAAILGAVECSRRSRSPTPSSTAVLPRGRIRGAAGARHALVVELGDLCPGRQADASLWTQWWQIQLPLGPALNAAAAYSALALGHALLARVRTAPLIPTTRRDGSLSSPRCGASSRKAAA